MGIRISVRISPGSNADIKVSTKKSAAAISRVPDDEAATIVAPSASAATGWSAATSACAIDPQHVPRLRTCRSPVQEAAVASAAPWPWTRPLAATSAWVTNAPIEMESPLSVMSPNPPIRPMSTTMSGDNNRIFIIGSRLMPPASTLAPGFASSAASASSRLEGAT